MSQWEPRSLDALQTPRRDLTNTLIPDPPATRRNTDDDGVVGPNTQEVELSCTVKRHETSENARERTLRPVDLYLHVSAMSRPPCGHARPSIGVV